MAARHFPKGLDGRQRDRDGEIRKKRRDTKVDTLRKEYGPNFCKGVSRRRAREGVESLDQLLRKKR